jgi:hypothetical protein
MRDPARWRDPSAGADAETRALLLSDRGPAPSHVEVDRIWSSLESQLPIAAGPALAPQAGQAVPAAGTGALAAKVTLAIVLVAGAGIGLRSIHLQHRREGGARRAVPSEAVPPASRTATMPPPGPMGAPTGSEIRPRAGKGARPRSVAKASLPASPRIAPPAVEEWPQVKPGGEAAPAPAAPEIQPHAEKGVSPRSAANAPLPASPKIAAAVAEELTRTKAGGGAAPAPAEIAPRAAARSEASAVSVNQLLEETRRLDRVRTALRAHDPDRALQLLRVGAPGTTPLAQEREALTIEAQAAKPSLRAAATERARAFMRAYPQSPYRARIRAIVFESE